ncbi:serine/threonine kinase, partial [Suhomyces tanzawaensis NRRL Y-17324]
LMGLRQLFSSRSKHDTFQTSSTDKRVAELGLGVSGTTELFRSRKNQLYVVKTYFGKEDYESKSEYKERVLHEYEVLRQLSHPNIIQVYSYRVSSSRISLHLEAGSPDLHVLLKQVPISNINPDEMLCLWKQLCTGIRYIHSLDFCHRDLKLQNLVLDLSTGCLKIIDWATATKITNNEPAVGLVGSKGFAAPEMFSSISYDGKMVDMWSLGIVLYYMLHKKLPWKTAQHSDPDFCRFQTQECGPSSMVQLPGDQATSQILVVDPAKRVSIDQLWTHQWFQGLKSCGESPCGMEHFRTFKV